MDCPNLEGCPFFYNKMAHMPSTSEMMKKQYCRGDNSNCARFIVSQALGGNAVPDDLYPSQVKKAEDIIKKK